VRWAAAALLLPLAAVAASAVEGCADCHGKDGASTESDVPIIAGQSAAYLKDAMDEYRGGDRPCPESRYRSGDKSRPATDMCRIAKALSDKELAEAARAFSDKPFVRARQKTDPARAAAGKKVHELHCEKCHAEGGSSKEDDAGILAGQWMPYLEHSFKEFADGSREAPKKMRPKLEELTADDKAALIQYYGSFQ
jgi:sulfide dehydrogenase cytochrome subunit